MKITRRIGLAMACVLLLGGADGMAAPPTETGSASFADAVAANLGGSWLVTIEGQRRPRTLTVFGLAKTGFGAVAADSAWPGCWSSRPG